MSSTAGKVISCQAAVAWEPKTKLTIETIEVAPPKANEVRVKLAATGVCHTDASALAGTYPGQKFPAVLGHEGAGVVESVGEGVTEFKADDICQDGEEIMFSSIWAIQTAQRELYEEPIEEKRLKFLANPDTMGDHVILLYVPQCGDCKFCNNPNTNLCLKYVVAYGLMLDGTSRLSCKGQSLFPFFGISTFSEYTVVGSHCLVKISEAAPLNKVNLLGCGIPTGYGSAIKVAKVTPGSTCAIWGLGGVGLAAVMGCKAAGAKRIIGIDINPDKFEIARQFGCTDVLNPKDHDKPTAQVVVGLTEGMGADFTFECIGNVATIRSALESCCRAVGVATIVGLPPAGVDVTASPFALLMGRTWRGGIFGGYRSSEISNLVDLYLEKKLLVDEFITHTMPLDKINDAFDYMRDGSSIRSVVELE